MKSRTAQILRRIATDKRNRANEAENATFPACSAHAASLRAEAAELEKTAAMLDCATPFHKLLASFLTTEWQRLPDLNKKIGKLGDTFRDLRDAGLAEEKREAGKVFYRLKN